MGWFERLVSAGVRDVQTIARERHYEKQRHAAVQEPWVPDAPMANSHEIWHEPTSADLAMSSLLAAQFVQAFEDGATAEQMIQAVDQILGASMTIRIESLQLVGQFLGQCAELACENEGQGARPADMARGFFGRIAAARSQGL